MAHFLWCWSKQQFIYHTRWVTLSIWTRRHKSVQEFQPIIYGDVFNPNLLHIFDLILKQTLDFLRAMEFFMCSYSLSLPFSQLMPTCVSWINFYSINSLNVAWFPIFSFNYAKQIHLFVYSFSSLNAYERKHVQIGNDMKFHGNNQFACM